MPEAKRIKFLLNGCDISFVAEAPEDITLKQLLAQADRICPDWCACGICSVPEDCTNDTELSFDYNDVKKVRPSHMTPDNIYYNSERDWGISCTILPKGHYLYE